MKNLGYVANNLQSHLSSIRTQTNLYCHRVPILVEQQFGTDFITTMVHDNASQNGKEQNHFFHITKCTDM